MNALPTPNNIVGTCGSLDALSSTTIVNECGVKTSRIGEACCILNPKLELPYYKQYKLKASILNNNVSMRLKNCNTKCSHCHLSMQFNYVNKKWCKDLTGRQKSCCSFTFSYVLAYTYPWRMIGGSDYGNIVQKM